MSSILEKFKDGFIIGDGGYVFALEKRGYVAAGPWTPEVVVEHPEAVRQLHREFLRAGSDILQALTFYASGAKLINRGNKQEFTADEINSAACQLVNEIAKEKNVFTAGGLSQTPCYLSHEPRRVVEEQFMNQVKIFLKYDMDLLICEYFEHLEEIEMAINICKSTGKPVAATMCIGPEGDLNGISTEECAVRMVQAGANLVGVNCHFDPETSLKTLKLMKNSLEAAGLHAHLMIQPLGYHVPDSGKQGFISLPEFPFALEPRAVTRWDVHKYAREAYKLGAKYIGGCCGFEPYHIRAISEELSSEKCYYPEASEKHGLWGSKLVMHTKPWIRTRCSENYWRCLEPATGRPFSSSFSKSTEWNVLPEDKDLCQYPNVTFAL